MRKRAHEIAGTRLERGDGARKLERLRGRQIGDRGSEQYAREQLILRELRNASERNLRMQARPADYDVGIQPLNVCFGADVEQRIGWALPTEADDPAVETEVAARKIIVPAHEIGPAGEARRVGSASDLKVRSPDAVDAETTSPKVAPRNLEVEPPGVKLRDVDDLFLIEVNVPNCVRLLPVLVVTVESTYRICP